MKESVSEPRLLIISPVRDEGKYLQRTIDSIVAQTLRPSVWVIVDDGSSDNTPEIAHRAAERYEWIKVLRRKDRGTRKVGGGVVEAFDEGLTQVNLEEFEFVCKMDGDLELHPRYFASLLQKFEADPRLGTASGKCWLATEQGLERERTNDQFSLGACKTYRRECFQQIGGFVPEVMWDGIDCHRCRMFGWKAASFHDEELKIVHLRRMGSSYRNVYHGRVRWGYGQYFMGTHPLYALAIAVYRMRERPRIVGGLLILAGFLNGYIRRLPRYSDNEFRRFLRRWQLARLGLVSDEKSD